MFISSATFSAISRTSILQSQSDLADLQKELGSGTYADLGTELGSRSGRLLGLSHEKERLAAYTFSGSVATTRLSATDTVLTSLQSAANGFLQSLTTASSSGATKGGLQTAAAGALGTLISSLNASVDGQSVFGGLNTGKAPLAAYTPASAAKQAIDQAFQDRFGTSADQPAAASISASAMTDFLGNQFAALFDPNSFKGTWSSATDAVQSTEVAPGETVTSSVSANADPFRAMAQTFAMVAEYTGPGTTLSASAQQAVVAAAMKTVSSALSSLTDVQAGVGVAQGTVTAAGTRVAAQSDVLTGEVSTLHDTDPAALSVRLSALQTQLQASYEVTSALKKLSLTNYFSA